MTDLPFSRAVIAYVGWDTDAALPGRHPERIPDASMRDRVLDVIKMVDAEEPGYRGLWEWGREVGDNVSSRFPQLSKEAVDAVVALISFEWR
ncbi:hypothetical protein [Microbacterium natoriense]